MKALGCCLLLILFAPPLALGAEGVLPSPNLAPQHLFHLSPRPDAPGILPAGSTELALDTAYASVASRRRRDEGEALLDMEVSRVTMRWARGLGHGLEVEAEVPWLWMGAGHFDGAIDGFHRTLGLPSGSRNNLDSNDFSYRISVRSHRYAPTEGQGLGDAVVGVKWAPASLSGSSWTARGLLKLPTGDRDRGFGSGSADGSLGALGVLDAGVWRLTGSADAVYVGGTADPALRLGTHWAAAAAAGAARKLFEASEAVLQLSYFATPYHTGLPNLDRDVLMLSAGMRGLLTRRLAWAAGFTEDLVISTSPDFGLFLCLEGTFGPSP